MARSMETAAIPKPSSSNVADSSSHFDPAQRAFLDLKQAILEHLLIPPEDDDLIDVTLAVVKSHEIPGDPLWFMIIDASGGGKTELLRAFQGYPNVTFLSSLSERSLISGYRDPRARHKDPSLLPTLNEKILIVKDMAPLLSQRREARNVIFGQLRDAYDQFTAEGKGNLGLVGYEARFTMIAAGTPAIDRYDSVDQELGERFVRFRCRGQNSRAKVARAVRGIGNEPEMRTAIQLQLQGYLRLLPPIRDRKLSPEAQSRLAAIADFTAKARSPVPRDRRGDLQLLPRPEVGTRLGKELGKLLLALAAVRGKTAPDEDDFKTIERVAGDCLPPTRLLVLGVLRAAPAGLRCSEVERRTGLPHSTIHRTLEDLRLLGLVEADGEGEARTFVVLQRRGGS